MGKYEKQAANEGCLFCFTRSWKSLCAKARGKSQNHPCASPSGRQNAITIATITSPSSSPNTLDPYPNASWTAQRNQVMEFENSEHNESALHQLCTSHRVVESVVTTATIALSRSSRNKLHLFPITPWTTQGIQAGNPRKPQHNKPAHSRSPLPEIKEQTRAVVGLWAQAAERLDSTESGKLKALMGSAEIVASDHVNSVLSEARKLKKGEENHRWQCILDKIIKAAMVFKDVGDKAVAFDQSGYAGLGWSVVSFGLQFTANARDTREFALSSSEYVADLLVRYKEYERFRDPQGDQQFDELLVRVYKAILVYVIDVKHYLQQGSTERTMRLAVPVDRHSISTSKQAIDAADVQVKDFIIPLLFRNVKQYLLSQSTRQSGDSRDCLKSLAFDEMKDRFEIVSPALEGTCKWLLRNNEYREWTQRDQGLLWIKGKPGSGKSTLVRYALGHGLLESDTRDRAYAHGSVCQVNATPGEPSCNDRSVIVLSFFFHGRGAELQKTPLGLYRSILHQLLCHVQLPDGFPNGLLATFLANRESNDRWHWSLSQLKSSFENALRKALTTRPVWLFVDALDEAGEDNAIELVRWFASLIQKCSPDDRFRICISCRHHPIVDDDAPKDANEICVEKFNNQDIAAFVESELESLDDATPEDLESIRGAITSRANGVFMWAHLVAKQVRTLKRQGATPRKIKNEITAIPDELHQLYRSLVEKMTCKPESLKVFLWVAFSRRPLSPQQFGWAMMVDTDHDTSKDSFKEYESTADWDWTGAFERNLKTHSYGLVEVAQSSSRQPIVQFIHQSVRDFFLVEGFSSLQNSLGMSASGGSMEGMANHRLSKACIRYLRVEDFARYENDDRTTQARRKLRSRIRAGKLPLLIYAIFSWVFHEQESEKRGASQDGLLGCLGWPSEAVVQRWKWLYKAIRPDEPGDISSCDTVLHVASVYRLTSTLRTALQGSCRTRLDALNFIAETPLYCAARAGHEDVVTLLLHAGADVDAQCREYGNALQAASLHGYLSIAELLLNKGASVNAQAGLYGTALQAASAQGHLSVAELLLENGSDVNVQGGIYGNALQAAAHSGSLPVVELLLSKGADVDSQGGYYGNALQAAASCGDSLPVVELLLSKGADVNARGGEYGNALQAAIIGAGGDSLPIIDSLLQQGADPIARGKYRTAFRAAGRKAAEVEGPIVDLLLRGRTRNECQGCPR